MDITENGTFRKGLNEKMKQKNSHPIHIDDLCKEFDNFLFDTSALNSPLINSKEYSPLRKRTERIRAEKDSDIFLRRYLQRKPEFMTTIKVKNECKNKNEQFGIRETFNKYDFIKISRKERILYKEICSEKKEWKKLIKVFNKKGRIVHQTEKEKERWDFLYNKYAIAKSKYNLSEVDYDLLITGAVLSNSRGKTAILSNDFPLYYAYSKLIKHENLDPSKYGFFIRIKKEFFSKMIPNNKIF